MRSDTDGTERGNRQNQMVVGDFNTTFSTIDETTEQKIPKAVSSTPSTNKM